MHRPQKPHSRGHPNNNTSPPRPPFHRHTSSHSSSSSTTTTTTPTLAVIPPTPSNTPASTQSTAKKGSSRPFLHHRKSASAHQIYHRHHHNNNHHSKSYQSLSKLLGPGSGPASLPANKADDDDMATSFLQYCAMCEKQITVPSNSVLYCSESCRRKDSCKPLSASSYTYTMSTSPSTSTNIEQHSPTMSMSMSPPRSISSTSVPMTRIPSDLHDSKTDLDPTEWKPVIHGYGYGGRGHPFSRTSSSTSLSTASSEAWSYLSQFHAPSTTSSANMVGDSSLSTSLPPFRRPTQHRSTSSSSSSLSTMSMSMSIAPSLANTPSTTVSSSPSSSPTSDYIGAYYACDAAARPLPPRHNPSFSMCGAGAAKGVELVVPHIIAPITKTEKVDVHDDDVVSSAHEGGIWLKA